MEFSDDQIRLESAMKWAQKPHDEKSRTARNDIIRIAARMKPSIFSVADHDDQFLDGKRAIISAIAESVPPEQDAMTYFRYLRTFAELIEIGNHRKWWRITIPAYPVTNGLYEKPFLHPESMIMAKFIDRIRRSVSDFAVSDLSELECCPSKDANTIASFALLSACVHAMQGTVEKLRAIASADIDRLVTIGSIAILPAALTFIPNRREEVVSLTENERKLFRVNYDILCDSVTLRLLVRLREMGVKSLTDVLGMGDLPKCDVIWAAIAPLVGRHVSSLGPIKSMGKFLKYIVAWLAMNTTGVLVSVASNNKFSPTLMKCAMDRLLTGQAGPECRTRYPQRTLRKHAVQSSGSSEFVVELKARLYSAHKRGLEGNTLLGEIQVIRERHQHDAASIENLFLDFIGHIIEFPPRNKKRTRATSLLRYVDSLGFSLIDAFTGTLPLNLNPGERLKRYYAMFEDEDGKEREYMAKLIVSFEKYLMDIHGIEGLNRFQINSVSNLPRHGSGNIITFDEYYRIRSELGFVNRTLLTRGDNICLSGFILGFRLGLRIGEIQRLRMKDMRIDPDPAVWVRSSELGIIKTTSSKRRMHLACYLDEDEIHFLADWYNYRKFSGAQGNDPLFPSESSSADPVNDDFIRIAVQDAMRRVTGDGMLNFRHLRHSFATWTLLRLMSTHIPKEARESIHAFRHPALSEASCSRLRQMLSPDTEDSLTGLHPVRAATYLVAAQLGHLGPKTSLEHYVHLLDFLLLAASNARQHYSPTEVMKMTGLKRAQAYHLITKYGKESIIDGNAMQVCYVRHGII